jgi:hypothetical protein
MSRVSTLMQEHLVHSHMPIRLLPLLSNNFYLFVVLVLLQKFLYCFSLISLHELTPFALCIRWLYFTHRGHFVFTSFLKYLSICVSTKVHPEITSILSQYSEALKPLCMFTECWYLFVFTTPCVSATFNKLTNRSTELYEL